MDLGQQRKLGDTRRRRCRALLACLLLALLASLGASPARAADLTPDVWYEDGHTDRWRIGGDWSYKADPLDTGQGADWASRIPADATTVQVPNVWNADLSKAGFDGSVGWYYARISVPATGRYRVRFLSTHHLATAYMDGEEIGSHRGGFLAWESRTLQLDAGEHLLAVRCDNRAQSTIVRTGGQGWWNWGGLSREVELRVAKDVDVESVVSGTAKIRRRSAVQRVGVTVSNTTSDAVPARVAISLAGTTTTSRPFMLAPGTKRSIAFRVAVRQPRLWSSAHPSLYPLELSTGGAELQPAWRGMIGIRRLVRRHSNLYLNGRRFLARGAALHDHVNGAGAALTPDDMQSNLQILRGMHANFTRSHYPLHPRFLEMLDRSGILMWAEAPGSWVSNKALHYADVRATMMQYLRDTIEAQASHASVGIWAGANELAPLPEHIGRPVVRYVRAAHKLAKQLDPLRPFGIASESRWPHQYMRLCKSVDVFGLNYYLGWYWGPKPGRRYRELLRHNVTNKMNACRHRAWLLTEFGAEAGFRGRASVRGSYAYQASLIDSALRAARSMRRLDGVTIWAGRDFAVDPEWTGGNKKNPSPPINQKGLVTLSGMRKPAYFVASRWFGRFAGRKLAHLARQP